MSENELITDVEIEKAFKDAERFLKMLDAFASVRDIAERYTRMKQGILAMQREQASIEGSIAARKDDLKKADADHKAKLGKLESGFQKKNGDLEKLHRLRADELLKEIGQLEERRQTAESAAKELEDKVSELSSSVAQAEAKAKEETAKLDDAIATKQGELHHVQASFNAFVAAHNLR